MADETDKPNEGAPSPAEPPPPSTHRALAGVGRAIAFVRRLDILPTAPRALGWREILPKGWLGWAGALLLWAVFLPVSMIKILQGSGAGEGEGEGEDEGDSD